MEWNLNFIWWFLLSYGPWNKGVFCGIHQMYNVQLYQLSISQIFHITEIIHTFIGSKSISLSSVCSFVRPRVCQSVTKLVPITLRTSLWRGLQTCLNLKVRYWHRKFKRNWQCLNFSFILIEGQRLTFLSHLQQGSRKK